jgi:transposase
LDSFILSVGRVCREARCERDGRNNTLEPGDKEKLELLARRPKTAQRAAMRAKIALRAAEGLPNQEIARRLGVTGATVGKWRERFRVKGMEGLTDEPRPGTPRKITDAKVEEAVTQTLESLPRAATHWSTRSLAAKVGLSQSAVVRIWRNFGLQPHRSETFKLSTDPQLVEKVRDIVGLYLNPPEHAIVLCVDEKSQVQALDRTQPILPLRPGLPEQRTNDYERHGTTSLFAALDIATGKVVGKCHRRHRHQEFLKFMELVDSTLPANAGEVHLVLDNYGTHKTPKVIRWFARHPRYRLHFTPTSGSWVNQVERWFGEITEKRIRRGSFKSVPSLEKAIQEYRTTITKSPGPSSGQRTPILFSGKSRDFVNEFITHQRPQYPLPELLKRISNSGH